MKEFFEIPGLGPNKIAKDGTVKSRYGKILKHMRAPSALYYRVKLWGKGRLVHRLLALTFIPNPLNLPMINHKDGNKLNNSLDNLEWCTLDHNMKHAQRTGLLVKGTQVHTNILDEVQVLTIIQCLKDGMSPRSLGRYFKVHDTTIGKIKAGKNWKHLLPMQVVLA